MTIRLATAADLPLLAAIERSATELFSPDDLPPEHRGDTLPLDRLQHARANGLLWVALAPRGAVAGFLAAEAAGDELHVCEMSVTPEQGGKGLGRALLATAIEHGRDARYAALTLTTFAHVPWNRPFYERLGFRALAPEACGERLQRILQAESRSGLRNRVAMRRDLP
ncbi:GNAT family N-acetyltransferase [Pseudomonas resinovorans]|uniref:GNAT family N-acetyltransferase n=1 Tax=Metapseudomonas resinovorans TaxID=53412 RepID=A0ABT4Y485_METRE|nr:GNAT family N-acetyltransferase [Pseudomonas resinovorans]MDA8483667.1 GNAT family N-acetyltransferase [Pseudomonas resinovorans]